LSHSPIGIVTSARRRAVGVLRRTDFIGPALAALPALAGKLLRRDASASGTETKISARPVAVEIVPYL